MIKKFLHETAEKLINGKIVRSLPHGCDFFEDVQRFSSSYHFEVIVDVGANIGQSAVTFATRFKQARIISIEPVSSTFEILCKEVAPYPLVSCYKIAFGASRGSSTIHLGDDSSMNQVEDLDAPSAITTDAEIIERIPLDDFCSEQKIDRISFLKVDTEGRDLDVLKGAFRMLADQRIDFVEVEAGMNPGNTFHVPMEVLKSAMEQHGYMLFGIYEQMHEWPENKPHLRRSNLVFMSPGLIRSWK